MSKIENGELFESNKNKIFNYYTALEEFETCSHLKEKFKEELKRVFDVVGAYWQEKRLGGLSADELLQKSNKVVNFLESEIEKLGRENFIFYQDGNVHYNTKLSKLPSKKKTADKCYRYVPEKTTNNE